MTKYVWEKIDSFRSQSEFSQFVSWIEKQVIEESCEELVVPGNTTEDWQERHFKSKETGEIWKLVQPDPGYYPGAWCPMQ